MAFPLVEKGEAELHAHHVADAGAGGRGLLGDNGHGELALEEGEGHICGAEVGDEAAGLEGAEAEAAHVLAALGAEPEGVEGLVVAHAGGLVCGGLHGGEGAVGEVPAGARPLSPKLKGLSGE
jgi:hypothetical protein